MCGRMRSGAVAPTINQRSTIPAAAAPRVSTTSASERRAATAERSNEGGIADLFRAGERTGVPGRHEIGVDEQRWNDVQPRRGELVPEPPAQDDRPVGIGAQTVLLDKRSPQRICV